jgi:hypothetical protein
MVGTDFGRSATMGNNLNTFIALLYESLSSMIVAPAINAMELMHV